MPLKIKSKTLKAHINQNFGNFEPSHFVRFDKAKWLWHFKCKICGHGVTEDYYKIQKPNYKCHKCRLIDKQLKRAMDIFCDPNYIPDRFLQ